MTRAAPSNTLQTTTVSFTNPDADYFKKPPGALKDLPPKHPLKNRANHGKLLEYIGDRVTFSAGVRDVFVARLHNIDRELAGFQQLNYSDRKREQDNKRGFGPKPISVNLQLAQMQIDEETTYLLNVFAPDSGIYKAISTKDKQDIANGFALALNQHASKFNHFRHMSKGFNSQLKYNIGGWTTEWREVKGTKLGNKAKTVLSMEKDQTLYSGNALEHLDMYNFGWDISVNPVDLAMYGEFFYTPDLVRAFQLKQMEARGELHGVARMLADRGKGLSNVGLLYKDKPIIRGDNDAQGRRGNNQWSNTFERAGYLVGKGEVTDAWEPTAYVMWINPSEFGLSADNEMQIWKFRIVNSRYLGYAERLNNAHGMLPVGVAMPADDEMGIETKSHGEMLLPLQRFASFLLNLHQQSSRKSLHGVKIYNPTVVDLNQMYKDDGDAVAGLIAANPSNYDYDLNRAVKELRDAPDTQWTMRDFGAVMEIMQRFLPTDMLRQVADLERATLYQAAATVQSGNRRSLKIAKTINDQAMNVIRYQMMYNTYQYQQAISIIDPRSGQEVQIDPSQFRESNIEFDISDGLKSIDKLLTLNVIMDVIKTLVQTPDVNQEIDVIGLLDHFTSQYGDKTDLTQFRRKTPPPSADATQQENQQALNAQTQGRVPQG